MGAHRRIPTILATTATCLLALCSMGSSAFAAAVGSGDGVSFAQMDFYTGRGIAATQANTDWGRVEVDVSTLTTNTGVPSGYLNVYTNAGWVIQNLPATPSDPNAPSEYFDLDVVVGTPVSSLSARVDFSSTPTTSFADGTRVVFPVTALEFSAAGVGTTDPDAVGDPPPAQAGPIAGGATSSTILPDVHNLQTAWNQCFPMAIANSLAFLQDRYLTIGLPHPHTKGLAPGGVSDGSLVGELDEKVGRNPTSRTVGPGVMFKPMISAKFDYLAENNIQDDFVHRYQGSGFGAADKNLQGDFTHNGSTATDEGASATWQWICDQIKEGEDVEVVFTIGSGAHAVRVIGCGETEGEKWLKYAHDRNQTGTKDPNDTKGLETPKVTVKDSDTDGTIEMGTPDREIVFAFAESPVDHTLPSLTSGGIAGLAVVLLSVGAFAGLRRSARRRD